MRQPSPHPSLSPGMEPVALLQAALLAGARGKTFAPCVLSSSTSERYFPLLKLVFFYSVMLEGEHPLPCRQPPARDGVGGPLLGSPGCCWMGLTVPA